MRELESFRTEIDKCVKCGTCRSTCPTVRVLGRESSSARGKLAIIDSYLKGGVGLSETFLRHLKECTLCGACKGSCPNEVDTTAVFHAARVEFAEKKGLPFATSFFLKNFLDSSKIMPFAIKAASLFKGLVFKDGAAGLLSRFPLPLVGEGRLVPPIAKTFFLDLPDTKKLAAKQGKVAFYAGCGVNYLMPDVGVSSVKALEKVSSVVIPQDQVCCGMPAYYMGDIETARSLALKNLEVFESHDFDYVVTSCATCSHGLKTFKTILGDDPALKERVERFVSKVRDTTEFLANSGFSPEARPTGEKMVVTYHDPCHLGRAQGIRDEPRALIASNKNITLKEMRFPCSCCGLGGGVAYTNYDLSIEITKRKAESIRDTGADVVATACPGCIVQIRDALHRYGVKARVAHVVELL